MYLLRRDINETQLYAEDRCDPSGAKKAFKTQLNVCGIQANRTDFPKFTGDVRTHLY